MSAHSNSSRDILLGKRRIYEQPSDEPIIHRLFHNLNKNYTAADTLFPLGDKTADEYTNEWQSKISEFYKGYTALEGKEVYESKKGITRVISTPTAAIKTKDTSKIDFAQTIELDEFRNRTLAQNLLSGKNLSEESVRVGFCKDDNLKSSVAVKLLDKTKEKSLRRRYPTNPLFADFGSASLFDVFAAEEFAVFKLGQWYYNTYYQSLALVGSETNFLALVALDGVEPFDLISR